MRFFWLAALLVLHVLLGVGCKLSSLFALAHASGTFLFGIYLLVRWRGPFPLACWGAYVVGSEVLWRMANAPVPWQYADFSLCFVLLLGLARTGLRRLPWVPAAYFVLLLPAVIFTLAQVPLMAARRAVSFNLSGPLAVMVCSLFCSRLQLDDRRMQRLMVWLVVPVAAIAAAVFFGLSTTEVVFRSQSNFAATGGFGPNQVSCILGLGALYGLLLALDPGVGIKLRVVFVVLALWFAAHAALSFSRTGIYLIGGGLLTAMPFLSLKRLLRPGTIIIVSVTVVAGLVTWGYLVHFTGGKVSERFARRDFSNRDSIAGEELQIWRENILFGAGVGMSAETREESTGVHVASHTEYTRLVSEHGLFGFLAGVLLLTACFRPLTINFPAFTKAAVLASLAFALFYLAASGMRTASPGFLFGLAFAGPALAHRVCRRQSVQRSAFPHLQSSIRGPVGPPFQSLVRPPTSAL